MTEHPYRPGYDAGGHRLLVIGIDKYSSCPLRTARAGAEAVAEKFKSLLGNNLRIKRLLDEDATRDNILNALIDLQINERGDAAYGQDKNRECGTIIYLAGHGVTRRAVDGEVVGYFVPCDYQPGVWNSLIPLDQFTEARKFMASKHVLYFVDCCFAGTVFMRSMLPLQTDFKYEARHVVFDSSVNIRDERNALYQAFTGRRAYQVFAAGNYDQEVLDWWDASPKTSQATADDVGVIPSDHSPFTQAVLDGLEGVAADGFGMLTADSLGLYLRQRFRDWPNADHLPRHGYLPGHDGGDYVFLKETRRGEADLNMGEVPTQRKALIVLVSPSSTANNDLIGKDKTQWTGIEYHRCRDQNETLFPLKRANDGKLRYLRLIHTEESEAVACEMLARYGELGLDVASVGVRNAYDIAETQQAVQKQIDLLCQQLSPADIIVDITGATTPMSVGAAQACRQMSCDMQYCRPNHLAYAGGRPDTTRATVPILLR